MKIATLIAMVAVINGILFQHLAVAAQMTARPWTRGAGRADTSTWVGSNYTPEYASNQIQMWHDFRPDVIERELAAAKRLFGITTLRVFLHHMLYDAEKDIFLGRIEQFLEICMRHDIRPGFVFFDDCHTRKGITLEPQPAIKGRCNGRWAALQDVERKEENFPKFKNFVQDVVRPHREDPRVLWWETYNEPNKGAAFSEKLRELTYGWIMECEPVHPVLSCWLDNPFTEIVDVHKYMWPGWDYYADMNPQKGALFTEAGARWIAGRPSNGEPCEVIHWLETRKARGQYVPGVMLCWELMIGDSNTRWRLGSKDGDPEPVIPWHGLMWPDCTPYSLAEAEAIRHYTTGERQALLYEAFQEPSPTLPDGWTSFGLGDDPAHVFEVSKNGSGVCALPGDHNALAGSPDWTDYVMEAVVMLKTNQGAAGLILRVNNPGPGSEAMEGYYIGFDATTLTLAKLNNKQQPLSAFDISKLECKGGVPDGWNQLRVAVEGNRIRVWFNRMHPSADPEKGLRIDYTDKEKPVLSGCVGLSTIGSEAWFDNVVVLPISILEGK